MKTYKTVDVPATTKEMQVGRKCDLCGYETKSQDGWVDDFYKREETEIKIIVTHVKTITYPDNGSGTFYEIDLCPNCFIKRLVPWLKSEGANIEESSFDW